MPKLQHENKGAGLRSRAFGGRQGGAPGRPDCPVLNPATAIGPGTEKRWATTSKIPGARPCAGADRPALRGPAGQTRTSGLARLAQRPGLFSNDNNVDRHAEHDEEPRNRNCEQQVIASHGLQPAPDFRKGDHWKLLGKGPPPLDLDQELTPGYPGQSSPATRARGFGPALFFVIDLDIRRIAPWSNTNRK